MSAALQTLLSLCQCLQSSVPADGPATGKDLPANAEQWTAVIELATAHYLAPALWLALQEAGCVDRLPPDARRFLSEAHRLNVVRNTKIREQALELLEALGRADIKTVIMKGGVYLFEDNQQAFEARMMVDLDLLVPEAQLEESFQITRGLGYEIYEKSDELFQHLDPMVREGDLASIELHRHVGMQRGILPAEDVLRDAIQMKAWGAFIYIPTPTQRATQNIFHSEVQSQNNYALGLIPLRYLHDLLLLRARHEAEIDWRTVKRHLSRGGYDYLLPGFLYLADRFLDMPMPAAVDITAAARRHYGWCVAQFRLPGLQALVSLWGTVLHPLRRPPIEYIYGERLSLISLQINRLKYLGYLITLHKVGIFPKLSRVFGRIFRS